MSPASEIPDIVIGRLPTYLRALQRMAQECRQVTSSQELGEQLGISAAQIRKDLSLFGGFGKQGTGYQIEFLIKQLRQILKVDRVWDVALVGAGDIGHALARYQGFTDRGFRVTMVFDNDPAKIGAAAGPFTIQVRVLPGASDARLSWEISEDLRTWSPAGEAVQILAKQARLDGGADWKYVHAPPLSGQGCSFLRLNISGW